MEAAELRHLNLGALQLVDFLIDLVQLLVVVGAEVLTTRRVGNGIEQLLVDFDLHLLHDRPAKEILCRIRCRAIGTHANGVDADAIQLGDLSSRVWVDGTGIIHTIRQQDDDLRDGFAVLESADGGSQAVADGGAVFNEAVLHFGQHVEHHAVVGGQRHLGEGLT